MSVHFYKRVAAVATASLLGLTLGFYPGLTSSSAQASPREGFPGRRVGGGVRAPQEACLTEQQPLVALMPPTNLTLTTEAHPTLWFSLPEREAGKAVELRLFNQEQELVYSSLLPVQKEAGIVGFRLPEDGSLEPLMLQENYQWRLSIVCNADARAQDIFVQGWIRRVELDSQLEVQLSSAAPAEHPALYEQAGLWSDALTTLAEIYMAQPNNLAIALQWDQLLETSGLSQFIGSAQTLEYPVEISRVSDLPE